MNSRQSCALLGLLLVLSLSDAIFFGLANNAAGNGVLFANGFAQVPLVAGPAGTIGTGLAVLGALKLAAAAILAFRTLADDHDYDDGYEYVDSGYGGGHGHHRRHRRQAEDGLVIDAADPDAVFGFINALDTQDCGKQLVCELEARNPATLHNDEKLMISLFGKGKSLRSGPKAAFDSAAALGKVSKNEILCRKRYAQCPYTAPQMMQALRQSRL